MLQDVFTNGQLYVALSWVRNSKIGSPGTQMIVVCLGHRIIEAEIACGVNKEKCVLITRITLIPSENEFPFLLKRRQSHLALQ